MMIFKQLMKTNLITMLTVLLLSYYKIISACTTAIISGDATTDGRPILWKNEMTKYPDGHFDATFHDDGIDNVNSYIIFSAEEWGKVNGGVNDKGLVVCCSSLGKPNCRFKKLLVQSCSSIYEMETKVGLILDYLENNPGSSTEPLEIRCHITAIDAQDRGVVYGIHYINKKLNILYKYELDYTTPYLVAANNRLDGNPEVCDRYNAANRILSRMYDPLKLKAINCDSVVHTLMRGGINKNPFPNLTPDYVYDYHVQGMQISSIHSQRGWVVKGIEKGQDPRLVTIWLNLGEPIFGVSVPLFVAAGSIPKELNAILNDSISLKAPINKVICDRKQSIYYDNGVEHKIYENLEDHSINPYPLWHGWDDDNDPNTPLRPAIQSYTIPLEQHIIEETKKFVDSLKNRMAGMSELEVKTELETFQNKMAKLAYDCYSAERFPLNQYTEWQIGEYYEIGDVVTFNGKNWINKFAHASNGAWYPGAPDLWFWEEYNN